MFTTLKNWISNTPFEPPARFTLELTRKFIQPFANGHFIIKNRSLREKKKIFYTITPPARLDNIGDHAQVVSIKKWFDEYFPEYKVVELNKDQTVMYIPALRFLINDRDLIFLHSGGNLNDRSLWSEGARRDVVRNFSQTPIIQLPQTVFFSDSKKGRRELENSKKVYNSHRNLTIIARDPVSHNYIKDHFDVKEDVYPDFALMLEPEKYFDMKRPRSGVMLCLRRDQESNTTAEEKKKLINAVQAAGYDVTQFDTTLDQPIPMTEREKFLIDTLNKFVEYELVITDRFHGMIFAVITKTPCIAIDTVDHKISSSSQWFSMYEDGVRYVDNIGDVPSLIQITARKRLAKFDWQEEYFSGLADSVRDSFTVK